MKLTVDGVPIAKARHRCGCKKSIPISYDLQSLDMKRVKRLFTSEIKKAFNSMRKDLVLDASKLTQVDSFDVKCTFMFPTPYSDSYSKRNAKLWGIEECNKKPDNDNLEKFYFDCLTDLIWADDCQIVINKSKKVYAEKPRVEIEIMAKRRLELDENTEAVLKIMSPSEMKEFLEDVQNFCIPRILETFDDLLPQSEEGGKESRLKTITSMLIKFSDKHFDKIKKLNKLSHEAA